MPKWGRIISAAARPSRVRTPARAERGLLRASRDERTAAAKGCECCTCGITVYFRRRGGAAALAGALSGGAWPECADRWREPRPDPTSVFASRSGTAKSRPQRARQSKAMAPPPAPASIANSLLAAISPLALERLRALAKSSIWKVAFEALWRLGSHAAHCFPLRGLPDLGCGC